MDVINKRRSVRQYRNQPVEQEKIELLLRAGMQAPSAKNQQPWHFLVIQNRDTLLKLSGLTKNSRMLADASVAILLLIDYTNLTLPDMAPVDMAAATENILLEATNLGLGAVWIGVYAREERGEAIREICQVPNHLEPFCLISIGYPLDENANRFVDRYDATRVYYEKF